MDLFANRLGILYRLQTPAKQTVLSIEEYRDHLSSQGLLSLAASYRLCRGYFIKDFTGKDVARPPAIKRGIAALGSGRLSMLNPLIVDDLRILQYLYS